MEGVRILSTKKLQPNYRQYLLNAGLAVLEADFIGVKFKSFLTQNIAQNLIFTSTNAFKSFMLNPVSKNLISSNVFCVGSKTAAFIRQNGFTVSASAEYASGLAEVITAGYSGKTFTFFTGNMRRDTLPELLTAAGIAFNEIEVYETVLTPHRILPELSGILFFSPTGVKSYLVENSIYNQTCFCIGTTTAEALNGLTDNIVVANKPSIENVIVQCINYYKR